ncbi:hypothetical protein [Martelella alba]|uniref:Uncharacterized protein n=1 Tax=Martelella alba TaxID=2590451 RepID=A0ABY2SF93_9HYPH|nr:hypothetical protein [Martelella alba]TKI03564.1 hypothetical protein FCN80_21030 [Martelella alba]
MIKKLIAWFYAIYFTPVAATPATETQPSEVKTVTDITASDTTTAQTAVDPTVAVDPTATIQPTPVQEVKTGVADFEAAYKFVVAGIEQLGAGAEDELKALAKKYL